MLASLDSYQIDYYCFFTHPGVAVGPEFCRPESPALRDPNAWVVSIGKCTVLAISAY